MGELRNITEIISSDHSKKLQFIVETAMLHQIPEGRMNLGIRHLEAIFGRKSPGAEALLGGYLDEENRIIFNFEIDGKPDNLFYVCDLPEQYLDKPVTPRDVHPFDLDLGGARGRLNEIKENEVVERVKSLSLDLILNENPRLRREASLSLESCTGRTSGVEGPVLRGYVTEKGRVLLDVEREGQQQTFYLCDLPKEYRGRQVSPKDAHQFDLTKGWTRRLVDLNIVSHEICEAIKCGLIHALTSGTEERDSMKGILGGEFFAKIAKMKGVMVTKAHVNVHGELVLDVKDKGGAKETVYLCAVPEETLLQEFEIDMNYLWN